MLLKITALSALVLLVQLTNANPSINADFETERAFNSLKFVSKTEAVTEDRMRRAAGAYKAGLKCYNQEPNGIRSVIDCDYLGGANFCAKMVAPSGTARTCGIALIMDAFEPLGLRGAGCRSMSGYTFCLCDSDKCN